MRAALPMYDRPELRGATDRFWTAIAERLHALGIEAPPALEGPGDLWSLWRSPDLLLAQTCGLPYRAVLHGKVALVGTPDYALPGCPPGYYGSVIVVRAGESGIPSRYAGARLAYNEPLSQSGWAAPIAWAGPRGLNFGPLVQTGSHLASARAVEAGEADIAAIDAVTWRLLKRYDTVASGLREIAFTEPTPGLPLITAAARDPRPIASAVAAAIATLPRADATALGIAGLVPIPAEAYLGQSTPPSPEVYAETLGA
ncbi:MAG: PhnD/SsuA/transferrin family substrate-binding protein [Pseudomonadota bacterium]